MRLIDADAIKLPKGFFEAVDNVPKFYEWLDDQSTINAVEVVRCMDCKFFKGDGLECHHSGMFAYEDDYCSNGERKEADG